MFASFDFEAIWQALPYLFLQGMRFTLTLTALSAAGGLAIGSVLAFVRVMVPLRPVVAVVAGYVNLMRSLPLLLVIFWFYFLVPYVAQWATGAPRPVAVGGFNSALVTFTLFEAAYFSEIVRSGIQSIPVGQFQAGSALGFSHPKVMLFIIAPQVFRHMLPVLLTQTIALFQDTSLVYVLSLTDFLGAASKVAQRDGRLVEMYSFAAVVYLVFCVLASRLVERLQARISPPDLIVRPGVHRS